MQPFLKPYIPLAGVLLAIVPLAWLPLRAPGAPKESADREVEKMFKKLDQNHDGFIDREEFGAKHEAHFARIDKNRDGKISKAELLEWFAKKKAREDWAGKGLQRGRGKSVVKTWAKI